MPPPPSEESPLLQANRKKERNRQQLFCKVASNFVHMKASICVFKHIILQIAVFIKSKPKKQNDKHILKYAIWFLKISTTHFHFSYSKNKFYTYHSLSPTSDFYGVSLSNTFVSSVKYFFTTARSESATSLRNSAIGSFPILFII